MYDADYEEWLAEQDAVEASPFITKDSGRRAQHSDGVVRDTDQGKTKFTLMFPEGVPMDQQLIVRIAELYTRGGEKYGDRNWENSKSADTLKHHTDALWRHFMNFFFNVQDSEDHAAAIVWNINAVELCRRNLAKEPTLLDDIYAALAELKEEPVTAPVTEERVLAPLQTYVFPFMPPYMPPGHTSFSQKAIQARSYSEAKGMFEAWVASGGPVNEAAPVPAADLEWANDDELTECGDSLDGTIYVWVYQSHTDTWVYKPNAGKDDPTAESARSLKKLCAEFGPLKCTKGANLGRIVDGS